jgi:diphosphomevalonate decarboxylase
MSGRRFAEAVAHPNIALAKYWGKRPGEGNVPATPSLSITLSGLSTRTRVTFDPDLREDRVTLGGRVLTGAPHMRVAFVLDEVRRALRSPLGEKDVASPQFAEVSSENDFPTASGLASSASGFCALTLAAVTAAGLSWDLGRMADLARRTSASSARSFFSGFAELCPEGATARAAQVAPKDHLPLSVLVCVTTEEQKSVSSGDGMKRVAERSPFYPAWVEFAARSFREMRGALLEKNTTRLGELVEENALAMHATGLPAGVIYLKPETLRVLETVRSLRARGLYAYATMDAGPHVKVLVLPESKDAALAELSKTPGVLRVIHATPGDGARIVAEGGA